MDIDIATLEKVAQDNKLSLPFLIRDIERALTSAYQDLPGVSDPARVEIDRRSGAVRVWSVEESEDGAREMDVTPDGFDHIVTSTATDVIKSSLVRQRQRDIVDTYSAQIGQLVSGVVQQGSDRNRIFVDLGDVEGVIPLAEQVPGEKLVHGDRIKTVVVDVRETGKGPSIILSRTHPDLVRALFALESPEISDGTVTIKDIAREAGYRTKIAVHTSHADINPKGACIGPMGQRVQAVTKELRGEKIDIVDYSDNPAQYVANALAPARVLSVAVVDPDTQQIQAIVPDYQISLAIGKEGQNARLAARLTGCRIDIRPDTD